MEKLSISSKEEYIFCRVLAEAFYDGFVVEEEYRLLEIIKNVFGLRKEFHRNSFLNIRQHGLDSINHEQAKLFIDPIERERAYELFSSVVLEAMRDEELSQTEWAILNLLHILLQLNRDDLQRISKNLGGKGVKPEIALKFKEWANTIRHELPAIQPLTVPIQIFPEEEVVPQMIHTRDQYVYYWMLRTALEDRVITIEEGAILSCLENAFGLGKEYRKKILNELRRGESPAIDQESLSQFIDQLDTEYEYNVYHNVLLTAMGDEEVTEDEWAILNMLRSLYKIDMKNHQVIEDTIRRELSEKHDKNALGRFERYLARNNTRQPTFLSPSR